MDSVLTVLIWALLISSSSAVTVSTRSTESLGPTKKSAFSDQEEIHVENLDNMINNYYDCYINLIFMDSYTLNYEKLFRPFFLITLNQNDSLQYSNYSTLQIRKRLFCTASLLTIPRKGLRNDIKIKLRTPGHQYLSSSSAENVLIVVTPQPEFVGCLIPSFSWRFSIFIAQLQIFQNSTGRLHAHLTKIEYVCHTCSLKWIIHKSVDCKSRNLLNCREELKYAAAYFTTKANIQHWITENNSELSFERSRDAYPSQIGVPSQNEQFTLEQVIYGILVEPFNSNNSDFTLEQTFKENTSRFAHEGYCKDTEFGETSSGGYASLSVFPEIFPHSELSADDDHGLGPEIPQDYWYITETRGFNFVTCHATSTGLSFYAYINPYKPAAWFCIVASVISVSVCLYTIFRYSQSESKWVKFSKSYYAYFSYLLFLSLLKQCIRLPPIKSKKLILFAFNLVLGTWILLEIVLSNAYEGVVVAFVVAPLQVQAKWEFLEDLKNFTLYTNSYVSIPPVEEKINGVYCYPRLLPMSYFHGKRSPWGSQFTDALTDRARSKQYNLSTDEFEPTKYTEITEHLLENTKVCLASEALDTFKRLSAGCSEKVAFVDYSEEIDRFTKHLEKYSDRNSEYFVKGKSSYIGIPYGWKVSSFAGPTMPLRMHSLVHSGIFLFWNRWMQILNPPVNSWTSISSLNNSNNGGKVKDFSGQKLNSNIVSVFILISAGLTLSAFVFVIEILFAKPRHYWCCRSFFRILVEARVYLFSDGLIAYFQRYF